MRKDASLYYELLTEIKYIFSWAYLIYLYNYLNGKLSKKMQVSHMNVKTVWRWVKF